MKINGNATRTLTWHYYSLSKLITECRDGNNNGLILRSGWPFWERNEDQDIWMRPWMDKQLSLEGRGWDRSSIVYIERLAANQGLISGSADEGNHSYMVALWWLPSEETRPLPRGTAFSRPNFLNIFCGVEWHVHTFTKCREVNPRGVCRPNLNSGYQYQVSEKEICRGFLSVLWIFSSGTL